MAQGRIGEGGVLSALREAVSSGQASSIRDVDPQVVAAYDTTVLPELTRLCSSIGACQNNALMNAAWKLLLAVASLPDISAVIYGRILHFMFLQLREHVLSHDWSDAKQSRLSAVVASYLVSAVRANPFHAACNGEFVNSLLELHITTIFTVTTSDREESARRFYQDIEVRLLAIVEAMGSSLDHHESQVDNNWKQLLMDCLRDAPSEVTDALGDVVNTVSISAVAAMTAMLAACRSLVMSLGEPASLEWLLETLLLWLPDMSLVLLEGGGTTPLQGRVSQLSREVPHEVYHTDYRCESDTSELPKELDLDTQLLLLLRRATRRCVELSRRSKRNLSKSGEERGDSCCMLQRSRIFSLLLTALLVPNDSSVARVLLVWETVLCDLSDAERRALGAELLLLGEGQLRASSSSVDVGRARVSALRRFLNLVAVIVAEVCRLLRCPPEVLIGTEGSVPSEPAVSGKLTFCQIVSALYHQSCVYQWWSEGSACGDKTHAVGVSSSSLVTRAKPCVETLYEEVRSTLGGGSLSQKQHLVMFLTTIPGKFIDVIQQGGCSSNPGGVTVMDVFSLVTSAIETLHKSVDCSRGLRVCIRFVAAELVAVAGLMPCEKPDYLRSVRCLVEISFTPVEGRETLVEWNMTQSDIIGGFQCVSGILKYHAAVCLRLFAQRSVVPVAHLGLKDPISVELANLIREQQPKTAREPSGDVVCSCFSEELLAPQVSAWQSLLQQHQILAAGATPQFGLVGPIPTMATQNAPSHPSSQGVGGRFLDSLQQCEQTLRSILHWQESTGGVLQQQESEVLSRVEGLVISVTSISNASRPAGDRRVGRETRGKPSGSFPQVIDIT